MCACLSWMHLSEKLISHVDVHLGAGFLVDVPKNPSLFFFLHFMWGRRFWVAGWCSGQHSGLPVWSLHILPVSVCVGGGSLQGELLQYPHKPEYWRSSGRKCMHGRLISRLRTK